MKTSIKLTAVLLCVLMLLPTFAFAYPDRIVENDPISMPKASPTIDGNIEDTGAWSNTAYLNDPTLGHFWATRPLTFTAEAYFAYDDSAFYFACDIHDNDADSGYVYTTGSDNIDGDYGFNGDVMTLMLDALGVFEKNTTYQTTPWYSVGMYENGKVGVYRLNGNNGDITSSCTTAGVRTEDGWRFEVKIPWSIIASDVSAASSNRLSATQAKLATVGSVSRAACMYLDRYYTASGTVSTWGRFISVCDEAYDGTEGISAGGTKAKTYGLTLNHTNNHEHSYSAWKTIEPTCTAAGYEIRSCSECGFVQTKDIPAKGHTPGEEESVTQSCTQDGSTYIKCTVCGETLSETVYPAPGHSMGEWYTVVAPNAISHGRERRECANCDYYEDRVIPSTAVPYISVDNYEVSVTLAENISHIRYASGVHTSGSSIKNAPDCVNIDSSVIKANTKDGLYIREMPKAGYYTFWVRMADRTEYILSADVTKFTQSLSSDGVMITVHDLYDVKDFFIAEGDYDSYAELKPNYIVNVTSAKIADKHDYTYTVTNPGIHTVLIRYNDPAKENTILKTELTVTEPTFTHDGLRLHIGNLEGVRVIRTATGAYTTSSQIKNAPDCRNFTAKAAIKGADPYTIQYRNNGIVSVSVQYNNGYIKVYQYDVAKKVPTFVHSATTVKIGNIDGLQIVRYAPGEYTTSAQIKAAKDSVYIRPEAAVDGVISVYGLTPGTTYTFCVQYKDESYNYYTVIASEEPALEIGSDRQVMAESYIINEDETTTSFFYGQPVKKQKVFTFDKAWENKDTVYHNITQLPDGTYRMYYKATSDIRRICYIESTDGITWTRPSNSINKYNNSNSNIVTNSALSPDNLFVFYDTNPNCPENQRWKGIYGQWGDGLFLEWGTDNGKNFPFHPYEVKLLSTPTETEGCYFDTLNTMYWDQNKGKYVAFVRGFHYGDNYNLTKEEVEAIGGANIVRDIRYSESTDCLNWSVPVPIDYSNDADWQMYANAIIPYYRSENLYIGMPTRYQWLTDLPEVDIFFMASRDLLNWERSDAPFMTDNGSTWAYGDSGYPCIGFIETPTGYGGTELSFYMKEWDESSDCTVLYRYTLRLDGFRGVFGAPDQKFVTKTFTFEGDSLEFNYACALGGNMKITIADNQGNSISTDWINGDATEAIVSFNGDLADFAGKPVTMTIDMNNASFYSFKFN
ncbi:MAG: hypothetical protein IJB57_04050 [Clostridia bacterium]|nr:hypothetical protein [Clostridia bacterium]